MRPKVFSYFLRPKPAELLFTSKKNVKYEFIEGKRKTDCQVVRTVFFKYDLTKLDVSFIVNNNKHRKINIQTEFAKICKYKFNLSTNI